MVPRAGGFPIQAATTSARRFHQPISGTFIRSTRRRLVHPKLHTHMAQSGGYSAPIGSAERYIAIFPPISGNLISSFHTSTGRIPVHPLIWDLVGFHPSIGT
ncbi:hypothetical protein AVEN_209264-1 [Araneus ventricosus]|uniref:Uncharacterized protein n=1 Tax=Araneus ventricosus TaxID=182803 RepID=A0A4Y2WEL3_ARAVE|nr:hypothetical protein AVEN_209264-1 [Araneus ventricosus]